jgi:hypothetical protein
MSLWDDDYKAYLDELEQEKINELDRADEYRLAMECEKAEQWEDEEEWNKKQTLKGGIDMITAKLHARWVERLEHWGNWVRMEVISIPMDGRRLVFLHFQGVDHRGSHYGQASESYDLIRDSRERKNFLRKYIGKVQISEELVMVLRDSESKCIGRHGDHEFPIEDEPWRSHYAVRSSRLR